MPVVHRPGCWHAAFIQADFREPGKIHADLALRRTLDLDKPVALMLIAVLHFFTDDQDPQGIVSALVDALPSGSYLTMTNLTADFMDPEQAARLGRRVSRGHHVRGSAREDFAASYPRCRQIGDRVCDAVTAVRRPWATGPVGRCCLQCAAYSSKTARGAVAL
jgi:S-adenosyl methyltransferase